MSNCLAYLSHHFVLYTLHSMEIPLLCNLLCQSNHLDSCCFFLFGLYNTTQYCTELLCFFLQQCHRGNVLQLLPNLSMIDRTTPFDHTEALFFWPDLRTSLFPHTFLHKVREPSHLWAKHIH